MSNEEFTSRVANQVKTITKDDYINKRFIIGTGQSLAKKFIAQKIQRRSMDRDMDVYKEVKCIEFEPVNVFECKHVEFKTCKALSKSKKSLKDLQLIYTRYGSTIKELYSIDRDSTTFSESTLYQLRNDSKRYGYKENPDKFYIIDDFIYVPRDIKSLSGLFLALDEYELDEFCGCNDNCEDFWEKSFNCPSSILDDVITYTLQHVLQNKQIPADEKPNLSNNEK